MVKTIEFYSPAERLPEKSGEYLCFVKTAYTGYFASLPFSKVHGGFNLRDFYATQDKIEMLRIDVAYWAYEPEMTDEREECGDDGV